MSDARLTQGYRMWPFYFLAALFGGNWRSRYSSGWHYGVLRHPVKWARDFRPGLRQRWPGWPL